ncbi:sensor histidine kinase [Rhizobium sp. No.120]
MTATLVFASALLLVATLKAIHPSGDHICEAAVTVIRQTLSQEPVSRQLRFAATNDFKEVEAHSPTLWFVAANGATVFEFAVKNRPNLPIELPYFGPISGAELRLAQDGPPVCVRDVSLEGAPRVSVVVAGADLSPVLSIKMFIVDEMEIIATVGAAFALIVAAGVVLAGRYVARSISDVTRLALAVDPSAPKGSIPLQEVPRELRVLVESLNGAFDEIATFIGRQRRFLNNVAHELRTPLAILRAKMEDVPNASLRSSLVLDTRRLTALVSAMLDLSRLENTGLERRRLDLVAITRDVLADYSPLALDRGIELSMVSNIDGPITIIGVEAAIRSAIANLVGNALVHARNASSVVAKLDRQGFVAICDDGTAAAAEAAMTPGKTTPLTDVAGMGLGLAIVREIMLAHNGTLTIATRYNGGRIARLQFPPIDAASGATSEENRLQLAPNLD